MSEYISAELRRLVGLRAEQRCEYCLVHEDDSFYLMSPITLLHSSKGRDCRLSLRESSVGSEQRLCERITAPATFAERKATLRGAKGDTSRSEGRHSLSERRR